MPDQKRPSRIRCRTSKQQDGQEMGALKDHGRDRITKQDPESHSPANESRIPQ